MEKEIIKQIKKAYILSDLDIEKFFKLIKKNIGLEKQAFKKSVLEILINNLKWK